MPQDWPTQLPEPSSIVGSDLALAAAMGAVLFIGLQHLGFWRHARDGRVHLWIACWCGAALAFQLARLGQLHADVPASAVIFARLQLAAVPFLIAALVAFANEFARRPASRESELVVGLGAGVLALLALTTPLFMDGSTMTSEDWFGRPYIGVPSRWTVALFFPMIAVACVFVVRRIRRTPHLQASERRVLLGGLLVYAGLGVFSIASSMNLISAPMLAQYGPLVVAAASNRLLANRHGRLLTELEQMVDERTVEIWNINRSLEQRLTELTATRSQRDLAHERLSESEARYRELVQEAPLGVISCDRRGEIQAVNPKLVEMVGAPSAGAMLGMNLLDRPHFRDSGASELFERCLRTGEPTADEATYTSEWGRDAELRLHLAARFDAEGEVVGVQAIVEDITEERRLHQRLRQSQRVEAVGRLAAGIAHEINNPMAYVRTNLGLLRDEIDRVRSALEKDDLDLVEHFDECDDLIDESLHGVDRTIAIVRDVRAMSHGGDDGFESVDLNEVVVDSLRVADHARSDGVDVHFDRAALPPVRCSPGQLQQVFVNLLVNGFQALGDRGSLTVSSRLEGPTAVVRVEDDGPGIAPEAIERLCDPFFTTKPTGQGTGLGLYMAHEILRIHGGELVVDRDRHPGAAFEVRLEADIV